MHTRGLTAASLLAALGVLAGCDAGNDPGATGDTSYQESEGQAPTPGSSVSGEDEQSGNQGLVGAGETASDRTSRAGARTRPEGGQAGQNQTGQTAGGGQMGVTEFAALDTNSDGKLGETEWQPQAVGGMEFQQIDEDASGDIDREEFRQAMTSTQGASQGQGSDMNTLDDPTNQ